MTPMFSKMCLGNTNPTKGTGIFLQKKHSQLLRNVIDSHLTLENHNAEELTCGLERTGDVNPSFQMYFLGVALLGISLLLRAQ